MSVKTRLTVGAGLAVALMAVAACSSSSSGSPNGGGSSSGSGSAGGSGASAAAAASPTKITFGTSGATAVYLPLYVGVQDGVFAKYGLDVKLDNLTPAAITAATLSDNINMGWDGPGLVSGILSSPSAAKVIFTTGPTVFYIYAQKGIKSIQDLKGKTIAVTTPGGGIDGTARAALIKAGLKPDIDVKFAYLQTNSAALAAVETGSVQAAGISPPTSIQATQSGLVQVADITSFSSQAVIAANTSWASSHSAAITKFIEAWKAAVQLTNTSESDAARALKTYVKLTDQAQIEGSWQAYKGVWLTEAYPVSAMKTVFTQLANSNPPVKAAATADPASVIDNQYINAAS